MRQFLAADSAALIVYVFWREGIVRWAGVQEIVELLITTFFVASMARFYRGLHREPRKEHDPAP